jgi:hypothetical protein
MLRTYLEKELLDSFVARSLSPVLRFDTVVKLSLEAKLLDRDALSLFLVFPFPAILLSPHILIFDKRIYPSN